MNKENTKYWMFTGLALLFIVVAGIWYGTLFIVASDIPTLSSVQPTGLPWVIGLVFIGLSFLFGWLARGNEFWKC